MLHILNLRNAKGLPLATLDNELDEAQRAVEGVSLVVQRHDRTLDHTMPLFTRRRLFAGFAAVGAVAGVFGIRTASARYYDGPVSDHFDGTRFFDPYSSPPKSLATLFRWYMGREKSEWPELGAEPVQRHAARARRRAGVAALVRGPRELAAADRGPQHPDRSGVVGARLAGELRRAEARQRSRHRIRRAAADRRRAGLALPLRPSRRRDAVAAARRASSRAWSRRSATTPS